MSFQKSEQVATNTLTKDQALTLTFSQQQEIERTTQQLVDEIPPLPPSQHQGPVIEDIFEHFPRPLYELAVSVAQDMANKKGESSLLSSFLSCV